MGSKCLNSLCCISSPNTIISLSFVLMYFTRPIFNAFVVSVLSGCPGHLDGEALSGRFVYSSQKRGFPDGDSLETNHIVPSLHFTLISLWLCSTPSSCARCWRMALLLVPVRILSVLSIGSQFGFAFQAWYLCCVFPIPFWFIRNDFPFLCVSMRKCILLV